VPFRRRRAQRLGQNGEAVSLTEISPVLVVNIVPLTPMKSPRSRCVKMSELLVAEDVFLRVALDASALVAHVNEHGFAHVAVRGDAAGDGDFAAFDVIGAGLRRRFPPGVNLFLNGSMPLARSAASLALRCSINEFVSSMPDFTRFHSQAGQADEARVTNYGER
jgi:hypothetical protein